MPVMKIKILQALFLCSLCIISTKLILSIVKNNTMIEVEVIDNVEKSVTYEEKVVNFLDGFVEKPAENNDKFLDKVKRWIVPEPKKEKKTIIGQINTIYRQQRSKVAEKFYLGSELLTIVEFSLAKIAAKYLLVNVFI